MSTEGAGTNIHLMPISKTARALFRTLSSLCLLFTFPGNVYAADYTCMIHGSHKSKCNVWRNGREIAIGGFQAAPVFTLTVFGQAVDQRGEKYNIVYKNGSTTFLPVKGNPYSAITIYGGNFR